MWLLVLAVNSAPSSHRAPSRSVFAFGLISGFVFLSMQQKMMSGVKVRTGAANIFFTLNTTEVWFQAFKAQLVYSNKLPTSF